MSKEISAEKVIAYMTEHLMEHPSLSRICKHFGYSRNYFAKMFSDIFGLPYTRFLNGLLMRDAADKLIQGGVPIHEIATRYGFASSYQFSRAFKREIGSSPRQFLKGDRTIPDMPARRTVDGQRMFLNYVKTEDFDVTGYPVKAVNGIKTDLLRECAYHMEHSDPDFDKVDSDVKISFWWSDNAVSLYYFLGSFDYMPGNDVKGTKTIKVPGTSYAVFSVERTGNDAEDLLIHREMVRYAMLDWVMINRKKPDRMYYTYEVFDKAYTYLYLPLQENSISPELITYMKDLSIDSWISYIDSRIEDNITVKDIAAHFNYSETHFRRTFKMYFDMTPQEYIRKRRLYFAAAEISRAKTAEERKHIAVRYYFRTLDYFNTMFIKEFRIHPDNYMSIRVRAINLAEYYTNQKDSVTVTFEYQKELILAGFILAQKPTRDIKMDDIVMKQEAIEDYDIPVLASYWMLHDPDEIKGTPLATAKPGEEDKAAVWYSAKGSMNYEYVIGYVLDDADEAPPGYEMIHIKAGKYAIFESLAASDRSKMADTYRMLLRCSFYGWIKENRYRVDFSRLTFVRFTNSKLYFYIPINE